MKFPFDELNMCDAEHVGWVKSQRDPELWHAAAIAIVNTVGDPHGFLVWLADQPETDRATAGYFFLGVFGVDYLRGQTDFPGEGLVWSAVATRDGSHVPPSGDNRIYK